MLDLSAVSGEDAKRLIDFSAGTIFRGYGSIIRLSNMVFVLEQPGPHEPPPGTSEAEAPATPGLLRPG